MNFTGKSLALSGSVLADAASGLSVEVAAIWAVLSVETYGTGFLPDRRPQILFERHVFSRLTGGQFDAAHPDISSRVPGGYGAPGAHQYDRLTEALALDQNAALKSASWGLAQIMGSNYRAAKYKSVLRMVKATIDSEDNQVKALCNFISDNNLVRFLAAHDWTSFARGYNGPNFAANRYDVQLRGFYAKYSVGAFPDLVVRAAQLYLTFKGFDPHGVDGILGNATRAALISFQTAQGLPITGEADDATMKALQPQ